MSVYELRLCNLTKKEPKINIYIIGKNKRSKDNNKKRYDELCWMSYRDAYEKGEPMDLDQPISCNKIHPRYDGLRWINSRDVYGGEPMDLDLNN